MTNSEVKAPGKLRLRAGAHVLGLLAAPLNASLLRALENEPTPLADLRRAVGFPAHTTMRARMRGLAAAGALDRARRAYFPGPVDCRLDTAGIELLRVADLLEAWLAAYPSGALALGEVKANRAVKALAKGWSAKLVRALAARPLTLTELNRLISDLNYPSLERRLTAMRQVGLIAPVRDDAQGKPYEITAWMRAAAGPLVAAAAWEMAHRPAEAAPFGRIDFETTFLLAAPLLRLPADVAGVARLTWPRTEGSEARPAGVTIAVRDGRVASCVTRLRTDPDGWASAPASAWLAATTTTGMERMEIGGAQDLVVAIIAALREAFTAPRRALPIA